MLETIRTAAKSLVLEALSVVKAPLGKSRFRRAVESSGPVRVNIGAGLHPAEGWLNTDIHWRTRHYLDVLKPWPVPRDKVTHIYADNVIEHFTIPQVRQLLNCAHQALAPGGSIRLVTPDVEAIARAYLDNSDLAREHLERHKRHGYSIHHDVDLLRITFSESEHWRGFCFDAKSLGAELLAAGFVNLRQVQSGASKDPIFRGLESRTDPTDAATALVMEGDKANE